MTTWYYAGSSYDTQVAFEAAVSQMKANLDGAPTTWCIVTSISGSEEDGWVIPDINLTDAEINAITETGTYQIASIIDGDIFIGLNATDTVLKVAEMRTRYAQYMEVNNYTTINNTVTNEDMSGYL